MQRFSCSLPTLTTTALVLALHWVVLQGLPWQLGTPTAPAGPVMRTRTIATPAPAPAPVALPSQAQTPATNAPKPAGARSNLDHRATAQAKTGTSNQAPVARADEAVAQAAPAAPEVPEPLTPAPAPDNVPAPPPSDTAPQPIQDVVAVANDLATQPPVPPTSRPAGVDITPPGGSADAQGSTAAPPVHLPVPTKLLYDVQGKAKGFHYQADAELRWQHDGTRYEARQVISAFLVGKRSQHSMGAIGAHGLEPERFADRSRSEQAAHFDHTQGRITFSANTPAADVGAGAQDRLSVFIQLGAMLAADPQRFMPGTEITLTTASARSADRWTFRVQASETLDLPLGPTATRKLERLARKEYDQKAELWLAPDLGYLPVRIRLTQANGDFADLQLRAHEKP